MDPQKTGSASVGSEEKTRSQRSNEPLQRRIDELLKISEEQYNRTQSAFPNLEKSAHPTLLALQKNFERQIFILKQTSKALNDFDNLIDEEDVGNLNKWLLEEDLSAKNVGISKILTALEKEEAAMGDDLSPQLQSDKPPRRLFRIWQAAHDLDSFIDAWSKGDASDYIDDEEPTVTAIDRLEGNARYLANRLQEITAKLDMGLNLTERKSLEEALADIFTKLKSLTFVKPPEKPSEDSSLYSTRKDLQEKIILTLDGALNDSDFASIRDPLNDEFKMTKVQGSLLEWIKDKSEDAIGVDDYEQTEEGIAVSDHLEDIYNECSNMDSLLAAQEKFISRESIIAEKNRILDGMDQIAAEFYKIRTSSGEQMVPLSSTAHIQERRNQFIQALQEKCGATRDQAVATWYLAQLRALATYKQTAQNAAEKVKRAATVKNEEHRLFGELQKLDLISSTEKKLTDADRQHLEKRYQEYSQQEDIAHILPRDWEAIDSTIKWMRNNKKSVFFNSNVAMKTADGIKTTTSLTTASMEKLLPDTKAVRVVDAGKKTKAVEDANANWKRNLAEDQDENELERANKTIQRLKQKAGNVQRRLQDERVTAKKLNDSLEKMIRERDTLHTEVKILRNSAKAATSSETIATARGDESHLGSPVESENKHPGTKEPIQQLEETTADIAHHAPSNSAPTSPEPVVSADGKESIARDPVKDEKALMSAKETIQQLKQKSRDMERHWRNEIATVKNLKGDLERATNERNILLAEVEKLHPTGQPAASHQDSKKRSAAVMNSESDYLSWKKTQNSLLPANYREALAEIANTSEVGPPIWVEDGKAYSCIYAGKITLSSRAQCAIYLPNPTEIPYPAHRPKFLLMLEEQLPDDVDLSTLPAKKGIDVKAKRTEKDWSTIMTKDAGNYRKSPYATRSKRARTSPGGSHG